MIQQYNLTTSMGSLSKWDSNLQSILTEEEIKELDTIGYSGKNSKGEKSSFEKYLNSLNKGEFDVKQTKFDNGTFIEKFNVVRVFHEK
jgi:hypothetical protein